jgi:multiple sugar transport system substrate-binding protein
MKKIVSKILSFCLVATSMVSVAGCEDALSKIFSSTDSTAEDSSIESSIADSSSIDSSSSEEDSSATEEGKDGFDFANTEVEVVPYDGSEVTVTFYHTLGQSRQDVLNRHLEVFNDMYPNIHVEHVNKGGYSELKESLENEIEKGSAPTMAFCYPDHVAAYNRLGATVALDDYINHTGVVTRADGSTEIMGLTDMQKEDFIQSFYQEGRIYGDNRMYTLPFGKSTEVLYYNVDYFTENNLTVPSTWEEMKATCARILEIESAKEGGLAANPCIPLGYDSEANWFITMTEQLGSGFLSTEEGNEFVFNNEENRAFMEEFKEWYDLGYVTTGYCNNMTYTSELFVQTDASQLKSYMVIGSSAGSGYHCPERLQDGTYPFEVGLAPVPQVDPDNPKMILQGPSVCLFKQEDPQELAAAWLLMEFLTTNANFQGNFSMVGGYAPVIQSIQQHPTYQHFLELADGNEYLWVSSVVYTMNYMSAYFIPPVTPNSNDARNIVGELMAAIFLYAPEEGQSLADYVKTYFDVAMDMLENH